MHFPTYGTVWGKSSSGDVDIGRWWVEGNRYCRAWRRWQSGEKTCWTFASDGGTWLIWVSPDGSVAGESNIQVGNTIGGSAQSAAVVPSSLRQRPAFILPVKIFLSIHSVPRSIHRESAECASASAVWTQAAHCRAARLMVPHQNL